MLNSQVELRGFLRWERFEQHRAGREEAEARGRGADLEDSPRMLARPQSPLCPSLGLCILPLHKSAEPREVLRRQFSSLLAPSPPGIRIVLPEPEGTSCLPSTYMLIWMIFFLLFLSFTFSPRWQKIQEGSGLQSSILCVILWPRVLTCFARFFWLVMD